MKSRTLLLIAGAAVGLSAALVGLASAVPLQAENKTASASGSENNQDTRSEAQKRAARRAANEARQKKQGVSASDPAPREEEEEKPRKP